MKPIIGFVAVGRPNLDQESTDAGMVTEQQKPTILLVSELRGDLLAGEFGRYVRDYEVQTATSAAEAEHHAQVIRGAGGQVALLVTESALPDADVLDALDRWRAVVPTARCLVAAHVEGFLDESAAVRRGLANGAFDAWVLMPRGARDEEFHNAVTELLSGLPRSGRPLDAQEVPAGGPIHRSSRMAPDRCSVWLDEDIRIRSAARRPRGHDESRRTTERVDIFGQRRHGYQPPAALLHSP